MCLTYFYPDVEFIVPPEMEDAAKAVPPLKPLRLCCADDGEAVTLTYEGKTIGSMRENRLRDMVRDYSHSGREAVAASRDWAEKPLFSLAFYESLDAIQERWKNSDTYKEFTLTGNGNEDMQSDLACMEPGMEISTAPDWEKDKTLVSVGPYDIGYCPAAMETYIGEHTGVQGRILKITESDSGKLGARVMLIADD